jgi:hypothetical protein
VLDDVDIARWEDDGGAVDICLADDPPGIPALEEASAATHQAIDAVSVPA